MKDKEIQEGLGELASMAERDHEVQMARADLYKIAKYAIKLHDMLKGVSEAEGIEGWQQSKITKAADYIGSVYHALDYDMKFDEGVKEGTTYSTTAKTKDGQTYSKTATTDAPVAGKKLSAKDYPSSDKGLPTKDSKAKFRPTEEGVGDVLDKVGAAIHKAVVGDKKKKPAVVTAPAKDTRSKGKMKPLMPAQHEGKYKSDAQRKAVHAAKAEKKESVDSYKESLAATLEAKMSKKKAVVEKAKSKAQQKFMGMVYAAKKGEKPASPEVAKVAKGMSKADAKDFAQTKHKGKPEHVKKK
jgi:hypothetical protein